MPRLVIFAACEKVIIDERSNALSLISLLEGIEVDVTGEMPIDARIPFRFEVVSEWAREAGETSKQLEQKIEIVRADKTVSMSMTLPVTFNEGTLRFRSVTSIDGVPVGVPGELSVTLSSREAGKSIWAKVGRYPILVTHNKISQADVVVDPRQPVGYHVYRSTDPNLPKDQWTRVTPKPIPDTNFTDKDLKPGMTYFYYVTAVNSLGIESGPSEVTSATTFAPEKK